MTTDIHFSTVVAVGSGLGVVVDAELLQSVGLAEGSQVEISVQPMADGVSLQLRAVPHHQDFALRHLDGIMKRDRKAFEALKDK